MTTRSFLNICTASMFVVFGIIFAVYLVDKKEYPLEVTVIKIHYSCAWGYWSPSNFVFGDFVDVASESSENQMICPDKPKHSKRLYQEQWERVEFKVTDLHGIEDRGTNIVVSTWPPHEYGKMITRHRIRELDSYKSPYKIGAKWVMYAKRSDFIFMKKGEELGRKRQIRLEPY